MVESNSLAEARTLLEAAYQPELLADLDERPAETQTALADQIVKLNKVTPGGLKDYCDRARQLLEASSRNENPFDAFRPEVPAGVFLRPEEPEFDEMEQLGQQELSKLALVLIAGGLGERLGFSGIKVSLPVCTIADDYSYLRFYAQYALACEARARKLDPSLGDDFCVPFGIMVSDDTNDRTIALLEANNFFGMRPEQVDIMKQENVPALIDNGAKLAINASTGLVQTKPHGHGDIHNLLFGSGVAAKWRDQGKEWMMFIQDTNAPALRVVPSILGVSRRNGWEMNSVCVPRKPGESMGAICRLVKEDSNGEEITVNVEYNQLDALLKEKWNPDGDVPNDQGYSSFPGNTNTLLFKIPDYCNSLQGSGGIIPEFVNPKYANAERTQFKAPTRLECMMQDYPKLLQSASNKVGFTMYETWFCFSPAKNNINDAKNCAARGLPSFGAAQAEFDFYNWTNKMLRLAGVDIPESTTPTDCAGIPFNFGPKILLEPSFALTLGDLKERFGPGCSFKPAATIILREKAAEKRYENLIIDGTLEASTPVDYFRHFSEEFVVFVPAEDSDPEALRIRGYKPVRRAEREPRL